MRQRQKYQQIIGASDMIPNSKLNLFWTCSLARLVWGHLSLWKREYIIGHTYFLKSNSLPQNGNCQKWCNSAWKLFFPSMYFFLHLDLLFKDLQTALWIIIQSELTKASPSQVSRVLQNPSSAVLTETFDQLPLHHYQSMKGKQINYQIYSITKRILILVSTYF